MPTRQQYAERIRPELSERLGPDLLHATPDQAFDIDALAERLGGILEQLERQHLGASSHIQALMAEQPAEPWDGHGELAFLLYHLHYPPEELRTDIDALPELRAVWDAMAAVAATSPFTPSDFETLAGSFPEQANVHCNKWGDIYGRGKYEMFDLGWAWTLKNCLMNLLPQCRRRGYGIADFVKRDWSEPLALQPGGGGQVRIAIIGDWGSGKYTLNGLADPNGPACAVMDTLCALTPPPDYLIHLGDTYYSGTGANRSPAGEEAHRLVDILELYPSLARPGNCFALNSNHEMYGGGYGYFGTALSHPLFAGQQGCSYFALGFADWIVAGIDSAYFDRSSLYLDGGLGDPADDPQCQFLQQVRASGKKVILLSHHPGLSTDGARCSEPLWEDVTRVVKPDCWYWGHTHLYVAYGSRAASGPIRTGCIGHGSMPFAIPPGMDGCAQTVDRYSRTPLDPSKAPKALRYSMPRAKNGFVVLTLGAAGVTEDVYDIGNTTPIWSR